MYVALWSDSLAVSVEELDCGCDHGEVRFFLLTMLALTVGGMASGLLAINLLNILMFQAK